MISALGVPQDDFSLTSDSLYAVLDEGGTLRAVGAAEEIAWECGCEIALMAWRAGDRGLIRETATELSLSGYEGALGIIPAKFPDSEAGLLAMLLDIANEACGGPAVILVIGREDTALCRGVLAAALVTCGFTPLSLDGRGLAAKPSLNQLMRLNADVVAGALAGASESIKQDAETLVAKFASRGTSRARVGF